MKDNEAMAIIMTILAPLSHDDRITIVLSLYAALKATTGEKEWKKLMKRADVVAEKVLSQHPNVR